MIRGSNNDQAKAFSFEKKTKVLNQNMDDKNTMLHKLYIDYTDSEKNKVLQYKVQDW